MDLAITDYDAELEYIAHIFNNPELLLKYEEITAQDFLVKSHRTIFKLLLDLHYGEGVSLPNLEMKARILIHKAERTKKDIGITSEQFREFTGAIRERLNAEDISGLVRLIKSRSEARQIQDRASRIVSEVHERDVDDTLNDLDVLISDIRNDRRVRNDRKAFDAFQKHKDFADCMKKNSPPKTGLETLDHLSLGMIPSLWTIGGSTSVGKSTFLHSIVKGFMKTGGIGTIFSLEDDYDTKFVKMACDLGDLPFRKVKFMDFETPKDEMMFNNAKERVMKYPLEIIDDAFDLTSIYNETKKAVIERGINFIAVDYIQNVHVPGANDIYSIMKEVVMQLYKIQKKFGITVIMLSQLNRKGDYKGAGEIENQSDLIIRLTRPDGDFLDSEFYKMTADGRKILYMNVEKNRLMGIIRDFIPIQYTRSWMGMEESDWPDVNNHYKEKNKGKGAIEQLNEIAREAKELRDKNNGDSTHNNNLK